MKHSRRIIIGVGALLLPLSVVGAIGAGPAFAKGSTAQPGTISCNSIKGSFKFNPPLFTTATSSSETVTVKSTVTGCTTAGGGLTPKKGSNAVTSSFSSNGCAAVLEGAAKSQTITTKWAPGTIAPSVVTFPPPKSTTSPITITYGGAGTTGTGSYLGSDSGASSTVTIDIAGTVASLTATCGGKKGLKGLTITGGTAKGQ
jgi:hypothetical protein